MSLKILSACGLLFISAFFFFQHMGLLWDDITVGNITPIFFVAGVVCVCLYIGFIVSRFEDGKFHRAERWDLIYKIIFSLTMVYIAIRAIFIEPFVGVPVGALSAAVVIGILNWFIPAISIQDDTEF